MVFRRRKKAERAGVHRRTVYAWSTVALPPPVPAAAMAPAPIIPPPASSVTRSATNARANVRLGFHDGTSVELDDSCGASQALRDVAARLTDTEVA